GVEAACECPTPARRIVKFCTREDNDVEATCNEYLAIGQQGRGVVMPAGVEAARDRPSCAPRGIQFRARGRIRATIKSPGNEDLAVGQQGRGVTGVGGVEAARDSPGPARRVVQFRTGELACIINASCNEYLAVGQQSRGVTRAGGVEAARG